MSKAVANLTQSTETITFSAQDNGETISVNITEAARGPAGAAGAAGPNSVTSATTSDGTANLSLSNVTTATATVTGTLTADHIHGNLAGSVYAHVRAGENLAKGDPVYVSGSHGAGASLIAIVSKADASDPLKMPAVGVMDAAVTANANGHMVITGTISDINTAAYAVNAELYVAEGGGFTATPPSAYAQPVARVERSNTNNGAVIVKVNGLSAISPTASTLVRRDSSGVSDFNTINLGDLHTGGSPVAPYGSIGKSVLTGSSGVGISGNPDVALEAATHRLTLSSTGVAIASGTITTSQPLSLTQTWNAGAVTFKGIEVNITDTSSASGSLLMDLRVGGTSVASFQKNGALSIPIGGYNNASIRFGGAANSGLYWNNGVFVMEGGNVRANITSSGIVAQGISIGFSSGGGSSTLDAYLSRDAANTLAQRNGTNAQESRIYGTYTGATNFERLNLKATGTAFQIGTEKGSAGGTARPLEFQTDGTTRMTIGATGLVTVNSISVNQSGDAVAAVVTSANTSVDTIQIKGTSSASYASMGFIGADNSQKGSFGYGNPSAGSFANLVFFQAQTGIDAAFGAGAAERMRIKSGGNVGVGTSNPASRFTVTGGDVEVTDSTKGVILKSPDGTRYRITVANGGTLTVTAV